MSQYIRTIIMEDGFKIEKEDPSLNEDTTVYVLKDSDGKHYILNEKEKIFADGLLVMLELNYFLFDVPFSYNDAQKNKLYKASLEHVTGSTEDANARKYLKNSIDVLYQTNVIDYEKIKVKLDDLWTEYVENLIEGYLAVIEEEETQTAIEIKIWLAEYISKRREEEYNSKASESEEFEVEEESFVEEQPASTGFVGFLKKIGTTIAEKAIDVLQYAESCKDDVEVYREKCSAWQRRGMDLRYYNSVSREQQIKYFRSFGIDTKEKYERFVEEIEEEIYN